MAGAVRKKSPVARKHRPAVKKSAPRKVAQTKIDPYAAANRILRDNDTFFVSRKGQVFSVNERTCPIRYCHHGESQGSKCHTHECFAHSYALSENIGISEWAEEASAGTAGDFGKYECELINRGWTRVRCQGNEGECNFTVKERNKNSLWNMWMIANAKEATDIVTEILDIDGLKHAKSYANTDTLQQAAEFAGFGKPSGNGIGREGRIAIIAFGALAIGILSSYIGTKLANRE
jgi:hypothetical protein